MAGEGNASRQAPLSNSGLLTGMPTSENPSEEALPDLLGVPGDFRHLPRQPPSRPCVLVPKQSLIGLSGLRAKTRGGRITDFDV
mmetsp:Transcript_74770/g.175440  ORF Transcript_74770/g.175440 Transcript_74770/m.175440 type:complete len:84 (+) Transcript_74770:68-319(+)